MRENLIAANDNGGLRYLSVCSGIEAATVAWKSLNWKCIGVAEIEPFPCLVLNRQYGATRPLFMPDPAEPSIKVKEQRSRQAAIRAVSVLPEQGPLTNWGDFTKIDVATLGRIDIFAGGTPCQAFSVAGLRQSLADARGNLSLEFVRLAHELADRNGLRNAVWENVVGVLSTKDNAFGCFLAGLVGADAAIEPPKRGKWPRHGMVAGPKGRAAWAVKDAQFFGVAQRRRRVLVVADFGNGADPAAVLFEPEGVFRHPPSRGEAGKDVAHQVAPSLVSSGRGVERTGDTRGQDPVVAVLRGHSDYGPGTPTLRAKGGDCAGGSEALVFAPDIARCVATREGSSQDYETTTMVAVEVAPTVRAGGNQGGGDRPYGMDVDTCDSLAVVSIHADAVGRSGVAVNPSKDASGTMRVRNPGIGLAMDGTTYNLMASGTPHAVCITGTITHTLKGEGSDASEDGTGRGTPIVVAFAENSRAELRLEGGDGLTVGNIGTGGGKPGQGYPAICFTAQDYGADAAYDIAPTLRSGNHSQSHQNGGVAPAIAFQAEMSVPQVDIELSQTLQATNHQATAKGSAVRRLTPMECERLQGFPDGYTRIPMRSYTVKKTSTNRPDDMWELIDGQWWLMSADGPRYKALGNSWAVPKFTWLGQRIQALMPANDNLNASCPRAA